jgi:hypothetical protein
VHAAKESQYNMSMQNIINEFKNELINKAAQNGESLYNNDVKESYINKKIKLKIKNKA